MADDVQIHEALLTGCWLGMDGTRVVTYTLDHEIGASLRGAGFLAVASTPKGEGGTPGNHGRSRPWRLSTRFVGKAESVPSPATYQARGAVTGTRLQGASYRATIGLLAPPADGSVHTCPYLDGGGMDTFGGLFPGLGHTVHSVHTCFGLRREK